jgi:mRNA deadenylase 3'-5' endonuclease subunit Ccr4
VKYICGEMMEPPRLSEQVNSKEREIEAIYSVPPMTLNSAYSNYARNESGEPEYPKATIHCRWYTGNLDYIFHSTDLQPISLLRLPEVEEMDGYLPNSDWGSDHLPIAAKFEWNSK